MSEQFQITRYSGPVRNRGNLYLSVQNLTDSSQSVEIIARDPAGHVRFTPETQHIQIGPEGRSDVIIGVAPYRPQIWRNGEYEFEVLVGNAEDSERLTGYLMIAPSPYFWILLIVTLFAALIGLVLAAFFTLQGELTRTLGQVSTIVANSETAVAANGTQRQTVEARLAVLEAEEDLQSPRPDPSQTVATMTSIPTAVESLTVTSTPTRTPIPTQTETPDPFAGLLLVRSYSVLEDRPSAPINLLADLPLPAENYAVNPNSFTFPQNGQLNPQGANIYLYEPATDFVGSDLFSYLICARGSTSNCERVEVRFEVTSQNDPPQADDDRVVVRANSSRTDLTQQLLTGDTDPDQNPLKIVAVAVESSGRIFFDSASGRVEYDPGDFYLSLGEGMTETETFQYTVSDNSATANATVTLEIAGVNDPPVPKDDGMTVPISITVPAGVVSELPLETLLAAFTDPDTEDQNDLTLNRIENNPDGGSVSLVGGRLQYDPAGMYIGLGGNETETDRFSYSVIDPQNAESQLLEAVITIVGANDPPQIELLNNAVIVVSQTVTSTVDIGIISDVTIFDPDNSDIGRILIQFTGNFSRIDGLDEFVTLDFEGASYFMNTDDLLEVNTSADINTVIEALKTARYVNNKIPDRTAGCRVIEIQLFDVENEPSNTVSVFLELDGGVCATAGGGLDEVAGWRGGVS